MASVIADNVALTSLSKYSQSLVVIDCPDTSVKPIEPCENILSQAPVPPVISQQLLPSVINNKYYISEPLQPGDSMCPCINITTGEHFKCKVVCNDDVGRAVLSAHYAVDGHPNINSLTEVIFSHTNIYLIFPQSYGDLHSYVRSKRRLRECETRNLFKQVAGALQTCHQNNIMLKDLKLKKFIFTNPQRSCVALESLCDSVIMSSECDEYVSERHGCPAYVSPEILTGGPPCYSGKQAVMWGLGVILYTLLIGRYPFYDTDPSLVLIKIRKGYYRIPDGISSDAKCLIRSLLQQNPYDRLSVDDIFYHPWFISKSPSMSSHMDHTVPQH